MKKIFLVFSIWCLVFSNSHNVLAFVNCQSKYDTHPKALNSFKGKCNVCHISPNGSGPQNEFGQAFKAAGFMITDELVVKFPDFFQKTQTSPSGTPVTPSVPAIKKIKPNKFKINTQSMATILGRNFREDASAFIDGNVVLTKFKSSVKLIIDFVLTSTGIHQVQVQNPDGQESNKKSIRAK